MNLAKLSFNVNKLTNTQFLVKTLCRNHVTTHYTIKPRENDERWKGKIEKETISFN